jgi:hypothetical protein
MNSDKYTNEKLYVAVLHVFSFDAGEDYVIPIFHPFLPSSSLRVHELTPSDLQKKRQKTKYFNEIVFQALLLTCMKEMSRSPERISYDLKFVCERISTDDRMLKTVAEDQNLVMIVHEHSHFIFIFLCSQPHAAKLRVTNSEIEWWMQSGNTRSCSVYDLAVQAAALNRLNISNTG